MHLPMQSGPKPIAWASIEIEGHLLTGEFKGGKWVWECETLPGLEGDILTVVGRFTRYAERNPQK